MASKQDDKRRKMDGTPLRMAEEVIHLQRKNSHPSRSAKKRDYIYEAQSSVMVTGVDDWVWTAYCFVDVYFKGVRHSEDVNTLSEQTIRFDPHSGGNRHPVDPPLWLPREYFLRTLTARMGQVKQEWNNSVSRLLQGTEPYVSMLGQGKIGHKSLELLKSNLIRFILLPPKIHYSKKPMN